MPNYDQTGPAGAGPLTGRGLGPCGRGMARGRGRGMGYGKFAGRTYLSASEEKEELEDEIKCMEADLNALKGRLEDIK